MLPNGQCSLFIFVSILSVISGGVVDILGFARLFSTRCPCWER